MLNVVRFSKYSIQEILRNIYKAADYDLRKPKVFSVSKGNLIVYRSGKINKLFQT